MFTLGDMIFQFYYDDKYMVKLPLMSVKYFFIAVLIIFVGIGLKNLLLQIGIDISFITD